MAGSLPSRKFHPWPICQICITKKKKVMNRMSRASFKTFGSNPETDHDPEGDDEPNHKRPTG